MEKAKDELIQKSRLHLIVLVLPESDPYFLGRKPTVTYRINPWQCNTKSRNIEQGKGGWVTKACDGKYAFYCDEKNGEANHH